MGFLTRRFVPRSVRRAMHPVRTVKRKAINKATPRSVKRFRRAFSPLSSAVYGLERRLNTKQRKKTKRAPAYQHGSCPVRHRTLEAAERCRNPLSWVRTCWGAVPGAALLEELFRAGARLP